MGEQKRLDPYYAAQMIAVCREIDKDSGEISVYPLEMVVSGDLLCCLKIRAMFNPELSYYVTLKKMWENESENMVKVLKRRKISDKALEKANLVKLWK